MLRQAPAGDRNARRDGARRRAFRLDLDDRRRDDWTDPRVLAKANPNIGISVYQDYLESQQQRAISLRASRTRSRRST
ncbi:putative terminase large subunit domain protein [Burkholderia thailandensis]|nr:putative terminase large subunit domain protein [Burkholderia thailandensis]